MTDNLKPDDWVHSFTSGIWRVCRVHRYKSLDPLTAKLTPQTTVFTKRFLTQGLKRSFTEETCALNWVTKLDRHELAELKHFVDDNPKLYADFLNYVPKRLDCVYNASVTIPQGRTLKKMDAMIPRDVPYTEREIQALLSELKLNTAPGYVNAQFFSPDFECRKGVLVFYFSRLYK